MDYPTPAHRPAYSVLDCTATAQALGHPAPPWRTNLRRMLAEAGHPVVTLVRTKVGPIHLGDTRPGKWRNLTSTEVGALYAAADL